MVFEIGDISVDDNILGEIVDSEIDGNGGLQVGIEYLVDLIVLEIDLGRAFGLNQRGQHRVGVLRLLPQDLVEHGVHFLLDPVSVDVLL